MEVLLNEVFVVAVAAGTETDFPAAEFAFVGVDEDGDEAVFGVEVVEDLDHFFGFLPVEGFADELREVLHL